MKHILLVAQKLAAMAAGHPAPLLFCDEGQIVIDRPPASGIRPALQPRSDLHVVAAAIPDPRPPGLATAEGRAG